MRTTRATAHRPLAAAAILLLTLTAGCAEPGSPSRPLDADQAADEFERRAAELAAAWPDSAAASQWHTGFLPIESLTVLPDQPLDEATELALSAGWLQTTLALPPERPDDGEVSFADGHTLPVPLISLAEAWQVIYGGEPDCPDPPPPPPSPSGHDDPVSSPGVCTVLTVTDAYPGTVPIATSRGLAQAPAWFFEIAGLREPLARVAVAPAAVTEVPRLEGFQFPHQYGLATAQALVATDGPQLTYQLGIGACDLDPTPLVYETADAVVVGGTARLAPGTTACTDQLVLAESSVWLESPLGNRPVLATTGEVLTFGHTW